jgi:hypothetical protein
MFDIIVRLIMSLVLIWMGLNLSLGPRDYKAFAENLKGPSITRLLVGFPNWVIRGLGILLTLDRRLLFCASNSQLASKVEVLGVVSGGAAIFITVRYFAPLFR